jgi:hypothetical protein
MAALSDTERLQIVQRLARYESPTEVAEWASEAFEKDIGRQQVRHYDPTRCDQTGERWAKEFEETRDQYLQNERRVAIAQKMWRLRQYQEIAEDEDVEPETRMKALKQAAEDAGGEYSNVEKVQQDGTTRIEVVYTDE